MPTSKAQLSETKRLKQLQKEYEQRQLEIRKQLLQSIDTNAREDISKKDDVPISVTDELAKREKIKNDDLTQDVRLKKYTLIALFIFLGVETCFVFLFMYFQATQSVFFSSRTFRLEDWSFRLMVTATITQITFMLKIAVQYLFPKR